MKTTIIIIAVALTSCNQLNHKNPVETAVKQYLKKTLDDPSSYEPVQFGKVDTSLWGFEGTQEYLALSAKKDSFKKIHTDYLYKASSRSDLDMVDMDSSSKYQTLSLNMHDTIDAHRVIWENSEHKQMPIHNFIIRHSFRAKNKFGAVVLNNYQFYVDTSMNVVDFLNLKE